MQFEVRIARQPSAVWSYLADWSHETEWQEGVVDLTVVQPGLLRRGTRKVKVRRTPMGNQRFTVEATRVDHEAREWEDVVLDGAVAGSTGHYRIVPDGDGTRVHLVVVMRTHGLARLLAPMIDRTSRADLAAGLRGLKRVLESSAED